MGGFETQMIDVADMADTLIYGPLKPIGIALLLILAIKFLLFRGKKMWGATKLPLFLFAIIKMVIYGNIAIIVFFYSFESHELVLQIPEKMYFSTFLVGCFSLYESISNLIEAARVWWSMHSNPS